MTVVEWVGRIEFSSSFSEWFATGRASVPVAAAALSVLPPTAALAAATLLLAATGRLISGRSALRIGVDSLGGAFGDGAMRC